MDNLVRILARLAAELERPQGHRARPGGGRARLAVLQAAWPLLVGERLARRSRVIALSEGCAAVEAEGERWAAELHQLAGPIGTRLQGRLPELRVTRISVSEGRARPAPPAAAPGDPAGPAAQAPASLRAAARELDPELSQRLLATAAGYLARRERAS